MTDQNAIVKQDLDIGSIATHFVKSGYFQDVGDVSKAIVKILAGRELGFGPFASMASIDVIQGKPSPGADLMASSVKASLRYDYRIRDLTESVCKIEFFERNGDKWESLGVSTFTADDARKAGTKNMERYPRNMLFARAMSNGVRWYCPDVFGTAVYTPEEMGADGDVIPGTFTEVKDEQPKPRPAQTSIDTARPYPPYLVREKTSMYAKTAQEKGYVLKDGARNMIAVNLQACFAGDPAADDKRHTVLKYLTGHASTRDLDTWQAIAVSKWLDAQPNSGGAWLPNDFSAQEARAIYETALAEEGQQQLI